ncbi:MAG: ABC transporter ATP-binding protein [Desulfurococcales archaeon]|nr:ABC transporter ATP-binding protein [Desulfurococcales archaeon]
MEETTKPLIELRSIVKIYPDGVKALQRVSLKVYPGEVHALLGENGAGKTTLMRILYGEIKPTSGDILIEGRPAKFNTPLDAIREGISMIYQHPRMVPTLTIMENIDLYFDNAGIPRDERKRRLYEAQELTGFDIPYNLLVEDASLGVLQRAEIVRSIAAGSRVLILDEPTTNLTPIEVEGLFKAIRNMKKKGISVIYITHRLPEVKEIADTVTVLRKGKVVKGAMPIHSVSMEELARLMVGELPKPTAKQSYRKNKKIIEIKNLIVEGRIALRINKLELYEGEILGIAGVEGNGQDELVKAILGILKPKQGEVKLLGERVKGPRDFLLRGGAYVPGDRTKALVQWFSIAENLAFLIYAHSGPNLLTPGKLASTYEMIRRQYNVVAQSPWSQISTLSGGNQQKLLVGSQLSLNPRVLLAVNPTRGLDVATTNYVRSLLIKYASKGTGVLLVSSDLDEILEISDRILVLYKGRIAGELSREEATPERIGVLMGGGSDNG